MNLTRNKTRPDLFNSLTTNHIHKQSSYSLFSNISKPSSKKVIKPPLSLTLTMNKTKPIMKTKQSKSTVDFDFLFKNDIIQSNNNKTNELEMIRKLTVWDKHHLHIHPSLSNDNLKKYLWPKREGIYKVSSFLDQGQLIRSHRRKNTFKIQDLFESKGQDKHAIRNPTKSTFDYTAFTQNANQMDLVSKETVDKINKDLYQGTYYSQYLAEKKKNEVKSRSQLLSTYHKIVIYNLKKEKCEGILNDIYKLLEVARDEYSMVINILKNEMKKSERDYRKVIENQTEYQAHAKKENRALPSVASNKVPISTPFIEGKNKDKKKDNEDKSDGRESPNDTITILSTKGISNTLITNKRKNITRDMMHEKLRIYIDFAALNDSYKEKIQNNSNQFDEIKKELTQLIKENKKILDEINKALQYLRNQFQSQSKKLKEYYSSLLKQGIDTRNEGLTWIIKRLLELNVSIDSSYFPSYLDVDQINYLINRSHLELEAYKLRCLLKTIKIRKQKLLNEDNLKRLEQFASIPIDSKVTDNLFELNQEESFTDLRDYMCSKFKEIYARHEDILKKSKEQIHEEALMNHIICTIKERINKYALYGNSIFDNLEEVKDYFDKHQTEREYYNDIKELRKKLDEIDIEIGQLRQNEEENFKRKYHYVKTRQEGDKASEYYENVYNALFGTSMISH